MVDRATTGTGVIFDNFEIFEPFHKSNINLSEQKYGIPDAYAILSALCSRLTMNLYYLSPLDFLEESWLVEFEHQKKVTLN